ncbi:MAG: hypothetical protein F6K19_28145 [Cyanothece sp. SIO1E1]|nr:hypothetical protein [Cyanothece sp. SIO1E1]
MKRMLRGILLPGILTTSIVGTAFLPVQASALEVSGNASIGATDLTNQAVTENDPVQDATNFSRFRRRGFRRGGFRRRRFRRRRFFY